MIMKILFEKEMEPFIEKEAKSELKAIP